ncbi:MAG: tRNA pseudouridine(38-40) synthase TruA [Candidatus Eremiobacteraeota bacterium]|nr:tRNA pseudouridine(38-40) synthase TruA [Candidatus Eremiobacteraeota bacterium]MBC5801523.1 tRNA pseudouridine(38-40) synthase TruA [Candidatus Eremiobacteraeota bacterium]MBC5821084.1 tRNA pseudouridine(38-40) synthase TruA [Candidatus Eremiobacteraeota bacterium]
MVVEYDGTAFCGFQFQPALRTIAGELEAALARLFAQPVKVTAAGRTDAGVHASAQVISFRAHAAFPVQKLALALNSVLPPDLSARDAERGDDAFSARNSALARHYTYTVLNRRMPSAVLRRFAHHDWRRLDLDAMRSAAAGVIGEHDFISFCGVVPNRGGTVRTLYALRIEARGDVVRLHFEGAGFLHRMVRILSGTLLEVGAGRRRPESVAEVLAARDRRLAGPTAPPAGLCLVNVVYPDFESRAAAEAFFR